MIGASENNTVIYSPAASFVGIKQEEALRMMKNQPQLNLTMGRRTKADNSPVTKKDHKETLNSVGRGWLVGSISCIILLANNKTSCLMFIF